MRFVGVICLGVLVGCNGSPGSVEPSPLAPPPPGQGLQVRMGPFQVPSADPSKGLSGEVQLCQTLKLPNDAPIAVNRVEMAKSLGSHHTILFRSELDLPDAVFPCWGTINFDDWEFLVDSQTATFDWSLPPGKAFVFKPHQQIMIQAHYQNARYTKTPEAGNVWLNLDTMPMPAESDVLAHAYGGFIVNRRIDLPPHSTGLSFSRDCVFNRAAYVFALYGHFHSRGVKFEVKHVDIQGSGLFSGGQTDFTDESNVLRSLYVSTSWADPLFLSYPDGELKGDGKNGYLIGEGEAMRYTCTYDNDSDEHIVFGSHADLQEHCNLFFHYALDPRDPNPPSVPFQCAHISGGW